MVEEVFHRHAKTNAHPASLSPQERGHLGHFCCLSTPVHNAFCSKGLHKLLVGVDSRIIGDSWDKRDLRQSDYSNTMCYSYSNSRLILWSVLQFGKEKCLSEFSKEYGSLRMLRQVV